MNFKNESCRETESFAKGLLQTEILNVFKVYFHLGQKKNVTRIKVLCVWSVALEQFLVSVKKIVAE